MVTGQKGPALYPVNGSTRSTTTPIGAVKSSTGRDAVADFMNVVHAGSDACAPVSPSSSLVSNPVHTTVSKLGVKPENHASLASFVVPVLPAAGILNPIVRAA